METLPFKLWLSGFLRWRKEAAKTLGARLPSEVVKLLEDKQKLAQLEWKAEEFRADAVGYYYAAKLRHIEKLQAEGVAKTAIEGMAKAQCHLELWARENAAGVAKVCTSRGFDVAAELKRQGVQ